MWSWEFNNMSFSESINNRLSLEQNYLWQMNPCITAAHELHSHFLFHYLPLLEDRRCFSTAEGNPGWPRHLWSSHPEPWDQLQHLNRAARPPRQRRAPLLLSTWKISWLPPGSSEGRAAPWLHSSTRRPPGQHPGGTPETLPPRRPGPAPPCNSRTWRRRLHRQHGLWGRAEKIEMENGGRTRGKERIRMLSGVSVPGAVKRRVRPSSPLFAVVTCVSVEPRTTT